ncbi:MULTISPECIES: flagellar FlbD family protein [Metabacillus]|uniref:Flagellar protein FlbD n=1 Tax=Metabacillus indicus TaxID=246786 RepID=A0A084H3U4_METID|nr:MULTISPECIES: flagellar FlbD family protein [Metabacillus]KEZ50097.1 hypothetical protein AZ46_0205160 [Metabacillus indicus LMG 22858]KEZ54256.1 hypothetical protein GS18_0204840 [Metabacillus indicus]MDX8288370.1 flagellar FlbD family protein [Metabacillus indicus]
MILLTRLNGKPFRLNAIYMEQIESFPDTTITLTNGKKFVVKESEAEVAERIKKFYQEIHIMHAAASAEVKEDE